ncbi:pyridine nucleotide-disulfide oxidoreductase [Luteitalea sp. TBR-22]|uniref:dihydrolipoyl dehydrogenase family protein n=1 Tax=Luteitalea sp. TBR-22 TaxID=2802971 RepID=UPI001AF62803|nr:NAD(P)/FAD-dependent oxidoreductase [Luteitalea sp. TBR-22]BCS32641.1 pyridine nucleotide-disulfide oxidoreductase [Luteitalea sp. TBR-22]
MTEQFDVVCLGGGVAAEALAEGLADSGLTLAIVERELVGGECPYWGCIPSKTLVRSGEVLAECGRARTLSASRVEWDVDFGRIARRALWMARDLDDSRPAAALQAKGATLIRGDGALLDARTVRVGSRQLTATRGLVIANGSVAAVPPIDGLHLVEYWTNRQATLPAALPRSLAVLGGGPIGLELGQAYARFGCQVTVIEAADHLLALEEPEVGAAIRTHLEAEGVTVHVADPCIGIDRDAEGDLVCLRLRSGAEVRAERLLVATGRRPRVEAWQAAGLPQGDKGWLRVDPSTLEVTPGVFVAGDAAGLGGFTHLADYHGRVIARRLRGEDARASHSAVARVTFTDPEVASVGLSEAAARADGADVIVSTSDPGETARGYIHDFHGGVLKLVADRRLGTLLGASILAPRAGEIIGELMLAIRVGTPIDTLADLIHPFPAFSRMLNRSFADLASMRRAPRAER